MVYLLRHGEDDESYIGGWSNVDLTDNGIKQVRKTAKLIKNKFPIRKIIASDIKRAVTTAQIVDEVLDINPEYSPKLWELNNGLLTGHKKEYAIKHFTKYFSNVRIDTTYPEGESMLDLYERSKELLEELKNENDTLVITHRGVINMFYYLLNNKMPDMDKEQFGVTHSSLHEFDPNKQIIKKIA